MSGHQSTGTQPGRRAPGWGHPGTALAACSRASWRATGKLQLTHCFSSTSQSKKTRLIRAALGHFQDRPISFERATLLFPCMTPVPGDGLGSLSLGMSTANSKVGSVPSSRSSWPHPQTTAEEARDRPLERGTCRPSGDRRRSAQGGRGRCGQTAIYTEQDNRKMLPT